MAKQIEAPADVEIAALRRQAVNRGDPMLAGDGTPWEDRGSLGAVAAFLKTAVMAMARPGQLFTSIRRAETARDARVFAFLCSLFWGVAWLVHDLVGMRGSGQEFLLEQQGVLMLVHFALGAGGAWVLVDFASRLFFKLASQGEMRGRTPQVLIYNLFAYAMGPSLLAVIPFYVGPVVALVWVGCLFVYGTATRGAVKIGGAISCTLIALGAGVGGGVAAYLLVRWLLGFAWGAPAA